MPVSHSNPQWSRFLNAVRAKTVTKARLHPRTLRGQDLAAQLQPTVLVDDVSYLAAPVEYALGGAGANARAAMVGGMPTVELSVSTAVEGAWVVQAQINGGPNSQGAMQLEVLDATAITGSGLVATSRDLGTTPVRSTVTTGTQGFAFKDAPCFQVVPTGPVWPQDIWIPAGQIASFSFAVFGTVMQTGSIIWIEVPKVATP